LNNSYKGDKSQACNRQKPLKNIGAALAKLCLKLLFTMEFLRVAKKYVRRKAICSVNAVCVELSVVFNELPIQSTETDL
jgi:hypothetical protein